MRRCLFCEADADSVEDAWPRWITDQFRGPQAATVEAERNGVRLPPWRARQPELTIRRVCRSCNNGWMSDLEHHTKTVVQSMLRGDRVLLDKDSQMLLARWSLKTSMVLEGLGAEEQQVYTATEREGLRIHGDVPWRTTVWLALAANEVLFHSAKNRHLGAGQLAAASTTIVFASLAVQVLTMRVPADVGPNTQVTANARLGPWESVTTQIWPASQEARAWPPEMGLNGEIGIDHFADRFNTSALALSEVRSLAV